MSYDAPLVGAVISFTLIGYNVLWHSRDLWVAAGAGGLRMTVLADPFSSLDRLTYPPAAARSKSV